MKKSLVIFLCVVQIAVFAVGALTIVSLRNKRCRAEQYHALRHEMPATRSSIDAILKLAEAPRKYSVDGNEISNVVNRLFRDEAGKICRMGRNTYNAETIEEKIFKKQLEFYDFNISDIVVDKSYIDKLEKEKMEAIGKCCGEEIRQKFEENNCKPLVMFMIVRKDGRVSVCLLGSSLAYHIVPVEGARFGNHEDVFDCSVSEIENILAIKDFAGLANEVICNSMWLKIKRRYVKLSQDEEDEIYFGEMAADNERSLIPLFNILLLKDSEVRKLAQLIVSSLDVAKANPRAHPKPTSAGEQISIGVVVGLIVALITAVLGFLKMHVWYRRNKPIDVRVGGCQRHATGSNRKNQTGSKHRR